ncbi:MAG: SAM-dependent methyltransferase, partial [Marinomonas sp.]
MSEKSRDLASSFRRLIRETGPITLAQYMGESNAHYYNLRDPLGAASSGAGDFITAPEISQMFGELIGLWCADIWSRAGRPEHMHYIELGPGRGTLASDALRAMAAHGLQPNVHLVEGSSALRAVQSKALPQAVHHTDASTLPDDAPLLIVANEFFDALAIHQLLKTENGWRERMIGLEDDAFAFVAGDRPMDDAVPDEWADAADGALIETCPAAAAIMSELADRLVAQGGAGLVIDYGYEKLAAGSTFQAIAGHQKVDPLKAPGQADLTAHVDFGALADVAQRQGAKLLGTTTQGEWLTAMG